MTNDSPTAKKMEARSPQIYGNANSLRRHQDNLRWTISASYVTFLGAALAFHKDGTVAADVKPFLLPALFCLGNCVLLILAIESWYYNIYNCYVSHCEESFASNQPIMLLQDFRQQIAEATTPFHFSFVFVLVLVALTNILFLHLWLRECQGWTYGLSIGTYLALLYVAFRFWNKFTYRILSFVKWVLTGKY
jgi:hypothetical protein